MYQASAIQMFILIDWGLGNGTVLHSITKCRKILEIKHSSNSQKWQHTASFKIMECKYVFVCTVQLHLQT